LATAGERLAVHSAGQDWLASWHGPELAPEGKCHGSDGVCFTADGLVVLVSEDGTRWGCPGGRPEPGEDWRAILDREVFEEACAEVQNATLLGFVKSECIRGHEQGLILVRAFWHASVSLCEWQPLFETKHRTLVPPQEVFTMIDLSGGGGPIHRRILDEALKVVSRS
jgi:ADP-ribose pyrophosphatase YjhB (NUDIX family)